MKTFNEFVGQLDEGVVRDIEAGKYVDKKVHINEGRPAIKDGIGFVAFSQGSIPSRDLIALDEADIAWIRDTFKGSLKPGQFICRAGNNRDALPILVDLSKGGVYFLSQDVIDAGDDDLVFEKTITKYKSIAFFEGRLKGNVFE